MLGLELSHLGIQSLGTQLRKVHGYLWWTSPCATYKIYNVQSTIYKSSDNLKCWKRQRSQSSVQYFQPVFRRNPEVLHIPWNKGCPQTGKIFWNLFQSLVTSQYFRLRAEITTNVWKEIFIRCWWCEVDSLDHLVSWRTKLRRKIKRRRKKLGEVGRRCTWKRNP